MEVFSSCLYELWQKKSVSWPQIHQPSRGLGSFYLDSNLNALVRSHPEISWNKMIITGFRHDFIYLAPCYYVAWLRLWKPKVWVKHHCFSWLCFPFVGVAFSHWTLKPPRGKKQVTSINKRYANPRTTAPCWCGHALHWFGHLIGSKNWSDKLMTEWWLLGEYPPGD